MNVPNDTSPLIAGDIKEQDAQNRVYVPLLVMAAVAFIGLLAVVFFFDRYGAGFADRMSSQLGDIEAARAFSLAESGLVDNAMATYRKALSMQFEDPNQRRWALRRFAELLVRENQPDEAAAQLRACLSEWPDYLPAHALLCQVLSASGQAQMLSDAARAWVAAAGDKQETRAQALCYVGQAGELLGRPDEALNAYEEGHRAWPGGRCSYPAAKLLYSRGDAPNALKVLDELLEKAPNDAGAAQALRDEIAAAMEVAAVAG